MTVRPLGIVYFSYLITGSFCALAAFCALADEPAQARSNTRTKDRRIRLKRFTGVLHCPAEVISGFRQDNLSLQEGGMIWKRTASCLDASDRRRCGGGGKPDSSCANVAQSDRTFTCRFCERETCWKWRRFATNQSRFIH